MSTTSALNLPSFRTSFEAQLSNLPPEHQAPMRALFKGLTDIYQAIPALTTKVNALKSTTSTTSSSASTASTVSSSSSSSSGISAQQAQAIALAIIQMTFFLTNSQTGTSYTVLNSDYASIITLDNASAVAITLGGDGTGVSEQFGCFIQNNGAGTATITPAVGTINLAANITLVTGQGALVIFSGTDWAAFASSSSSGGYSLGGTVSATNVALGAGSGTGGSVGTVAGLDGTHQVQFTTGTGPPTTGIIFTFTFTASRGHNTYPVISSAQGFLAATMPLVGGGSATSYTVHANGTALAAATTYTLYVSAP